MADAFEEVSHLAASENRIRALEALSGGCRDRDELREVVDVSKPTLSRLLRDFEEYGWIRATNGAIELTTTGDLLRREFQRTIDTVSTARRMGEIVESLPIDEFDFPLARLADADVRRHRRGAPFAVLKRLLSLWGEADTVRVVAHAISADVLEVQKEAAARGQRSTIVCDEQVRSVIESEPEIAGLVREVNQFDCVDLYHAEDTFACSVGVFDDELTILAPTDEQNRPAGMVESHDDVVRSWATDRIEDGKRRGTPVEASSIAE